MLITHQDEWQYGARKRTIAPEFKIGPVSLKFIIFGLLAVAGLFYLAQTMQTSAIKYNIMQIQQQKDDLVAKSKELEVEAARLKSLNEIKDSSQNLGLEPINQVNYIDGKSNNKSLSLKK